VSEGPASSRRLVRFGGFELDARAGELWKGDVRVNLQEQPFRVLECLLEHPGELVTRDELRQRLWQDDTFVDFEHGVNAAVKRLRETLGDSAETPRFIETLPRRGYRLIVPVELDEPPVVKADPASAGRGDDQRLDLVAELPGHPERWSRRLVGAGVAGILVTVAFAGWMLSGSLKTPVLPMKVVPLTSLKGFEIGPSFSKDGTRVAFAWDGEAQDNNDIYVQLIGSAEPHALTSDPAFEVNPVWSPDDMQIAYLRDNPEGSALNVWVMPSLGGPGHKVSDLPVSMGISWSPDGRYINAAQLPPKNGIYRIPVQGDEPLATLRPTASETIGKPRFSPNGRFLAYESCREPSKCHVQIVKVDATFTAHDSPVQLTRHPALRIEGITWSRDGQFVVYAALHGPQLSLWRVEVDGRRPEERIEVAGLNATAPTIIASGDLVFSRFIEDIDVYRVGPGLAPVPVAPSSAFDGNPQFSPDGRRFAFCSARSGDASEIWTAALNGSEAHQLTHGPGIWKCSPAWSADGKIAFDSQTEDGDWHIWTIDADGGAQKRITSGTGSQNAPTWSGDGHWIYYSWDQGSGRDIWRTDVQNGTTEQITHGGAGWAGRESADGQSIFYQLQTGPAALLSQTLHTRVGPHTILRCVSQSAYSVVADGIYYVPCQDAAHPDPNPQVHVLNPVTHEDRPFGRLERFSEFTGGLAVSPDGQTILYTQLVSHGADLMLIEHFR